MSVRPPKHRPSICSLYCFSNSITFQSVVFITKHAYPTTPFTRISESYTLDGQGHHSAFFMSKIAQGEKHRCASDYIAIH